VSKSLTSPTISTGDVLAPRVASSAVVIGRPRFGERSLLSEGAVVRSSGGGVTVGTGSAIIENCVVVGTGAIPTTIGRRTVFGHRCLVVGATVGEMRPTEIALEMRRVLRDLNERSSRL
jgi:carbonic anhydrase/acetyltransferase-like protein (isoleucine patch superfamily)